MARNPVSRKLRVGQVLTVCVVLGGPGFSGASEAWTVRPIDGWGANPSHPAWAAVDDHLLRESGPFYDDGVASPTGADRPNPRTLSNEVFAQDGSVPNPSRSDFLWTWGQFLDHDLGLTEGVEEFLPVEVPTGDPVFDPESTGTARIPFRRALFDHATGTGPGNPRRQVNQVTGYIDASNVYGSDATRASWLRTGVGGLLRTSSRPGGDLLPYNDGTQPNAGSPEVPDLSTDLFVAGDIRANEQPTLCVMHTLFVREHNLQAHRLARRLGLDPVTDDEAIYQEARRIVIAEIQAITYREFLPALLGRGVLGPYRGYRESVHPGISATFSTAAYRLGHTLLSSQLQRLRPDGTSVPEGPLALRDAFFSSTPAQLEVFGLEPFLRGLAAQHSQELDVRVIDDVRNFLFETPVPGMRGFDLVALNLQRGRDMGLGSFNQVRGDFGLRPVGDFADLTRDADLAATLSLLYGDIDDLDPFVGLLAEDDLPGRMVGPTLMRILRDQFRRSRDGDPFWYERTLTARERVYVERSTLSAIIRRNTSIGRGPGRIQENVFRLP